LEFAALSLQLLDLATLARDDMSMLLDPNENMYSFSFHAGACDLLVPHADHTSSVDTVEWQGETLNACELQEAARSVSSWLSSCGRLCESIVAVLSHCSVGLVVGVVGALLSGGSYMPLDAKWPVPRRLFIADDARCIALVAQSTHGAGCWQWFARSVLVLESKSLFSSFGRLCSLRHMAQAQSPVYAIYTSGTTGLPKGVLVSQGGEMNLMDSIRTRCHSEGTWRCGISFLHVFDGFQMSLLWCLGILGGTCVLVESGVMLAAAARGGKLTHLHGVHSAMSMAGAPCSVQYVHVGG
jgi:non-ribosomal peptide synthetase component F